MEIGVANREKRVERFFYSPFATRHAPRYFFTVFGGAFGGTGGFFTGFGAGVVGGVVDVVDQLGDARGVAAEIALEIARRRADIDARILAVGRDADRHVLAKSHDRRPRHRLDAADAARRLRRAFVDDQPFALGDQLQRDLIGALHRDLEFHRLDIGIGQPLLFGRIQPGIDRGVGAVAGAQPRQRLEARRIDRIGGDVVDRRQLAVLQAEIGRIGEHDRVDQQRQQDAAHAARAVLPDRGKGGEADQDGKAGAGQRAEERRQRRLHFQEAEADDDDRDHDRDHREYREIARP